MEQNNNVDLNTTISEYFSKRYRYPADSDLLDEQAIAQRLTQGIDSAQIWLAQDIDIETTAEQTTDSDDTDEIEEIESGDMTSPRMEYALIDRVDEEDPRLVWVIPMTNNEYIQNNTSLVIDKTPLGVAMTAWPTARVRIPANVLSLPLKSLPDPVSSAVISNKENPRLGVLRGNNPTTVYDRRIIARNVRSMLETFLIWSLECASLPQLSTTDKTSVQHTPSRADLLRQTVKVLGVDPVEAGNIIEGSTKPTKAQRDALQAAGISLTAVPKRKTTLPADLLIEVEQPMWRKTVLHYALSKNIQAPAARYALARDAFELAARPTGYGRQAWRGALGQVAAELK